MTRFLPTTTQVPLLAAVVALLLTLPACHVLPTVTEKPVSVALPAPDRGPLASACRELNRHRKPGESSFLLLEDAGEALKWRLALIDSARSSIDIQLYLWHGGVSSALLFERALQAADRGVRVRILVDDFLLKADDTGLATLCRNHPNFEIRIFNPGRIRGSGLGSLTEMIANFKELNRRMHNKTFTVDRSMAIVGGRNIGDHYYGMDEKYNFIDLDVLTAGPVVTRISDGFDAFWNDPAAFPGEHLSKRDKPELVREARAAFTQTLSDEQSRKLSNYPIERHDWSRDLANLKQRMVHGHAHFVQDDPNPDQDKREVVSTLQEMTKTRTGEVHLATPYLIPSAQGLQNVARMNSEGIDIRILVPSLAANNHAVVDGHYRKHRAAIVDGGSRLSEFRSDPTEEIRSLADVGPVRSERITLHLKAVVGDRAKCFIGSLNLDPRATDINTESGLLISSPELSQQVAEFIEALSNQENSWLVTRDARGRLQWESRGEIRNRPPPARWSHRLLGWISGLLPIEDQI